MTMILHPKDYKPYVILGTTQRCNYRCRMCFWSRPDVARNLQDSDPTMPMTLFRRALEEVVPHCSALCLAGAGEFLADPLAEERLAVLGDALRRHPEILLYQTTNASLLTRDKLQFLKGTRRVGFTISIDSVDGLTYASIRRPGTLSKVLDNIRSLRRELWAIGIEDVYLRLNMVVMKRNVFSLPDVLRFAKEMHAKVFVDHPQGFGPDDLHQESLFRFPVFSNAFLAKCRQLAETLDVALETPPPFAISPEEVAQYHDARSDRSLHCYQLDKAGPVQILSNGDVSVCCQNLVFGNLNQQPFREVFFSPRYPEYREAIAAGRPLPPCDHCRHLYRNAPYLYDSGVYDMDIPPQSRNLDPQPDFDKEGFFDWLNDLSEERLRYHLRQDYIARGKRLFASGISEETALLQRQRNMNEKFLSWIQGHCRIVVYPAGTQAAWLLKNTLLSRANIVGFSDRNPQMHGKLFHGYPVVAPEDIRGLEPAVLLVASDLHREEICRDLAHLEDRGITVSTIDSACHMN
ncbi:MAG: hypothetical protein A2V77_14595 [Anaeromyxobacter sp. RBG_16_69_14]|nr:MAG: hypothetical protein A2V77_14595 [Anaeromyxobacter sp. RBG_16_69_14]